MKAMTCDKCRHELTSHRGLYHYTESGLNNLYLDGVEIFACPNSACDYFNRATAAIPKIEKLHIFIAKALISQSPPLGGQEVRFLRGALAIKAKDLAAYLHVDPATLSRWEKANEPIGEQSELLIRFLVLRLIEEAEGQMITAFNAQQLTLRRELLPPVMIIKIKPAGFELIRAQNQELPKELLTP